MKKVVKCITASALITPLVITGPTVLHVAAVQQSLDDWVNQQISDRLEVGDRVTLDLTDYFGELVNPRYLVINHNHQIADVVITGDSMIIMGRNVGSTTIDLLVEHDGHPPMNDHFRLVIEPATELVDTNDDGLGIDDIVRYINTHPYKQFHRDNIPYILAQIPSIIQPANRPPTSSHESHFLTIPSGTTQVVDLRDFFFDPDGDHLTYVAEYDTAVIEVMMDEHLMAITGIGPIGVETGIIITASDQTSVQSSASKSFYITIVADEESSPPVVMHPIPDQSATEGSQYSYTIPEDTFGGGDEADLLIYSAALDNGDPLPDWLIFDSETRTFVGSDMAAGALAIRVTATNSSGLSASTIFHLTINEASYAPIALYENVEVTMTYGADLSMDVTRLFTIDGPEAFDISSVDGLDDWSDEYSNLLGYLAQDNRYFNVITSGDMSGDETEPTFLSIDLQAESAEGLLSDSVKITVVLDRIWHEMPTHQAGSSVNVSQLVDDHFHPYTLNDQSYEFEYSIETFDDWAEFDPNDSSLLHIREDAEGEYYIRVTATALDGGITIEKLYHVIVTQ